MKFTETDVWGFYHAVRGARNPMNSWNRMDSEFFENSYDTILGENDLNLLQRLVKAGPEHRKFMRQIMVSVDITAPLYIWKEFDTYKVGTTANSTSTMHKLASTPITKECFEMDDFKDLKIYDREPDTIDDYTSDMWDSIIDYCETLRKRYIETKQRDYWKELIRILPESWLQTRTVTMNYENLYSIVRQRKGHRLTEWNQFINWVKTLPYAKELIFLDYQ